MSTMTNPAATPRNPTDRQAARATTWTAALMAAPAHWAGLIDVQAPDRDAAWTAATAQAAERNRNGDQVVVQGVTLAGLTRTERETVRAFLSGRAVRLAADRSTGLVSREHQGGRVYVDQVMEPRELVDLDPDTMAAAGAELDRWRAWGRKRWTTDARMTNAQPADLEPHAVRCAASKVPEAFKPTGRVRVLSCLAWGEATAPTFPDTPAGRTAAARLARMYGGGRAALELDGVTVATVHNAGSAAHAGDGWDGPFRPLLRVLTPSAAADLGPRAVRILTAVRSLALMLHPDHRHDVELAYTSRELAAGMADPRDGVGGVLDRTPRLVPADGLEDASPTLARQRERVRVDLSLEPAHVWKLADDWPALFDTTPTTLDLED